MKTINIITKYSLMVLLSCLLYACGGGNTKEGSSSSGGAKQGTVVQEKQLNVSIFLDLSARLLPSQVNPAPKTRDLEAIKSIVDIFRSDMVARGAYRAKGRIKVFFSPIPDDPEINELASSLSVNLSDLDTKQRKEVYDNLSSRFEQGLSRIYDRSLEQQKWVGADIWHFFKKDVKDHCVLENYRNIVVLLTDGYVYHERSKMKEGNRYSYLLGPLFESLGLRKNTKWQELIERNDIGLISVQTGLEELEVLVLELCPENNHPQDEDILEHLLAKWFKEMGVGNYKIHSTDLPNNTKESIKRFFGQKV